MDFLLPIMSWVPNAVRRAQTNLLNLGFGAIPVITVEDLIIAKLVALFGRSSREKDMDDLEVIFEYQRNIDFQYLSSQMKLLGISVPVNAEKIVPKELLEISKSVRQNKKRRKP